jgi:hypothetical protein
MISGSLETTDSSEIDGAVCFTSEKILIPPQISMISLIK